MYGGDGVVHQAGVAGVTYTKITNVDRWLMAQSTDTLEALAKHPLIADLYKSKVKQYKTHKPRPAKNPPVLRVEWLDRAIRLTPEPPSANVIKAWLHHAKAKFRYTQYRQLLAATLQAGSNLATELLYAGKRGPVTITHTWVTVQPRDEDSFGLSLKPVLDALADAGILASDDPAHVSLRFGGQTSGGKGIHQRRGLTLRFDPRPVDQLPATDSAGGHPSDGSSSLPHGNS